MRLSLNLRRNIIEKILDEMVTSGSIANVAVPLGAQSPAVATNISAGVNTPKTSYSEIATNKKTRERIKKALASLYSGT